MGKRCSTCLCRSPCASVLATVMCLLGVATYCYTMYQASSITIRLFERVYKVNPSWFDTLQLIFVGIFFVMAAIGLMILFVSLLSIGYLKNIYTARRILCVVLIVITYLLFLVWSLNLCFLVVVTFTSTLFYNFCASLDLIEGTALKQLQFWLPENHTLDENLKICAIKEFCEERVEKAQSKFILATVSTLLVILSLVHYLMCLAVNYSHIRDDKKIEELLQIQKLGEWDYTSRSESLFVEPQGRSTDI